MSATDEQRLQIKRAILAELNKELSKKTKSLSNVSKKHGKNTKKTLTISTKPATIHKSKQSKHHTASSKYNAQPFSSNNSNAAAASHRDKPIMSVYISKRTAPHIQNPYECVRKYVDIWKSKTFGAVHDISKGRCHYRKTVLRKILSKWRDTTLSKQTEWKLIVRANCHYRFYLREKHWERWRLYLVNNKTVAANKQKADENCKKVLLKKYFRGLRRAVAFRKDYSANKVLAKSVFERNLAQHVLNMWHRSLAESAINKEKETIALHFWALSLQRQYFLSWCEYRDKQSLKKDIKMVISKFYHKKILQQSLRNWVAYHRKRKIKDILARRAQKLLDSKLRHKLFYHWSDQTHISIKTKELEQQIIAIRTKFVCRSMIQHWKCYVEHVRYERYLEESAANHAQNKLLSKCFTALKNYNQHQKHTEQLKYQAKGIGLRNIMNRHLQIWIRRMDEAGETKMKYRTLMARKHYEHKLMGRALAKLDEYKEYRLDRKDLYDIADDHYKTYLTQLMVTNWHLYVCYRKTVAVKKESAELYRNDLLYHKYFFTWIRMFHIVKNNRQDERIALLHCDKVLLTMCFINWKQMNEAKLLCHQNTELATQHFQTKLLQRSLYSLKQQKDDKARKCEQTQTAIEHFNKKLSNTVFWQWKRHAHTQRLKNHQKHISDRHHHQKLLQRQLNSWISHHNTIKKCKQVFIQIEAANNIEFVRRCFKQWALEMKVRKLSLDLNLRAEDHYRTKLVTTVLSAWLSYTEQRAKDHINKIILLDEAQEHLDQLKKRQVMSLWIKRSRDEHDQRRKLETAEQHYEILSLKKALFGFKDAVSFSFKKRVLQRKLENYDVDHTLKNVFFKWRVAFEEKCRENRQSEKALWFWCVNLEYKVLRGWLSYVQYRKDKSRVYSAAREDHMTHLLQTGLRQWIGSVTSAEQTRSEAALVAVTQKTYHSHQIALKWGKHWYNVVKRRAALRPVRPRETPVSVLNKENIGSCFTNTPNFYKSFNMIKSNRPPPKIPTFFVQRQYIQ